MTDDAPRNSFYIDFTDNPKARSIFSGKSNGDRVKLEIEVVVGDNNTQGCRGTIAEIEGGDDGESESPERIEGGRPSAESPVMIVMGGGMRKVPQNTRTL